MKFKIIYILFIAALITNCNSDDDNNSSETINNIETLDMYDNIIDQNGNIVECGPNPGCPPPQLFPVKLNFQFIDSNNEILNLNEENTKEISWTIYNPTLDSDLYILSQEIDFDITNNIGFIDLYDFKSIFEVGDGTFIIETGFDEPQSIRLEYDDRPIFNDPCNPCGEFFISTIHQNDENILFTGELEDNDLIKIKIN